MVTGLVRKDLRSLDSTSVDVTGNRKEWVIYHEKRGGRSESHVRVTRVHDDC